MEISEETADRLTKDDPMFRAGAEAMYRTIMADADKQLAKRGQEWWHDKTAYKCAVIVNAAKSARLKVLGE